MKARERGRGFGQVTRNLGVAVMLAAGSTHCRIEDLTYNPGLVDPDQGLRLFLASNQRSPTENPRGTPLRITAERRGTATTDERPENARCVLLQSLNSLAEFSDDGPFSAQAVFELRFNLQPGRRHAFYALSYQQGEARVRASMLDRPCSQSAEATPVSETELTLRFGLTGTSTRPEGGLPSDASVDVVLADVQGVDVQLPDAQLPDVQGIDAQLPDVQGTDVQLSDVQLPDVQLPDVQLPDVQDVQATDSVDVSSACPPFESFDLTWTCEMAENTNGDLCAATGSHTSVYCTCYPDLPCCQAPGTDLGGGIILRDICNDSACSDVRSACCDLSFPISYCDCYPDDPCCSDNTDPYFTACNLR